MTPIICPKCGYSNQDDSKFCTFCGHHMEFPVQNFKVNFDSIVNEEQIVQSLEDESITEINTGDNFLIQVKNNLSQTPDDSEDDIPTIANWNIPTELDTTIDDDNSSPRTVIDVRVANSVNKKSLALINPDTNKQFIFSEDKKIFYCGRYNEDFSVDMDFSGLPHSDIVSRVHFIFHIDSDSCYIEDAGSSNGTFLNGKQVKSGHIHRQKINIGDEIRLGKTSQLKLLFQEIENVVYSPSE
ncbi:FHA domain containing protein [Cyanobacterium sp. HL-69]|uniref:FHA domain-containing protein n=1 Tax=Cyanobacterium sp. HL-69 TaxID=2054282 RepID=UPI000CA323DB|nr:FHA domain containing protein [Cyanobacterium sp. HL-69]